MLRFVWLQLSLFPDLAPRRYSGMDDGERDRRTAAQWIKAVISYLEFSTGDAWRRLADPEQRLSPERLWHLGGLRTMNGIHGPAVLPGQLFLLPKPNMDTPAAMLARSPRVCLVDELLLLRPDLTDRKLLLHLPRPKLAGMLIAARADARSQTRRTA